MVVVSPICHAMAYSSWFDFHFLHKSPSILGAMVFYMHHVSVMCVCVCVCESHGIFNGVSNIVSYVLYVCTSCVCVCCRENARANWIGIVVIAGMWPKLTRKWGTNSHSLEQANTHTKRLTHRNTHTHGIYSFNSSWKSAHYKNAAVKIKVNNKNTR